MDVLAGGAVDVAAGVTDKMEIAVVVLSLEAYCDVTEDVDTDVTGDDVAVAAKAVAVRGVGIDDPAFIGVLAPGDAIKVVAPTKSVA